MRHLWLLTLTLALSSCSAWFFSGVPKVDRSRPVALVETTGGVEFGAATEFGVLTLGRTAVEGPCRVRYFLGPTPIVETGTLAAVGGGFVRAEIDLKTQHARAVDRPLLPDDELVAMWTPDGRSERSVAVELALTEGVRGDALVAPAEPLPTGAAVLRKAEDGNLHFVGLVAGRAIVDGGPAAGTYYVFAGCDRLREMLAKPHAHPVDVVPKFRPDDIRVMKRN
ncbi:MAG: hypothetical protein FJ301_00425 [Planctomycetes bacterium]|nr:hypothetical protein [Planctomycetota bacterium]